MKRLFTLAFLLINLVAYAQRITQLEGVGEGNSFKPGEGVIYGNFIQKLSFWKSGYQQYIRVRNLQTHEVLSFQVKSTYGGARIRPFCYYIPAGVYELWQYQYSEAKWYGTRTVTTPVFKDVDINLNVKNLVDSGLLRPQDLHRFTFKVEPGSTTYLGTWHFDAGAVFFTDEKAVLDEKIKSDHPALNFEKAVTAIPN